MRGGLIPKIILKKEKNGLILTIDYNAQRETIISEQLNNNLDIVILQSEKQDPSDTRQWAYSRLGSRVLFTTYLGYDYNGPIDRLGIYRSKMNLISHMKIEHVCAPERLIERHTERIIRKGTYSKRESREEEALYEYYSLAQALYRDSP